MVSRLKLSSSVDKRCSRLQDDQLPDCRRYGSYPEIALDEVIEANRRRTWTINALIVHVDWNEVERRACGAMRPKGAGRKRRCYMQDTWGQASAFRVAGTCMGTRKLLVRR